MDEDQVEDEIRSPQEVAYRAPCLFSVIGLAFGADRKDMKDWLSEHVTTDT